MENLQGVLERGDDLEQPVATEKDLGKALEAILESTQGGPVSGLSSFGSVADYPGLVSPVTDEPGQGSYLQVSQRDNHRPGHPFSPLTVWGMTGQQEGRQFPGPSLL